MGAFSTNGYVPRQNAREIKLCRYCGRVLQDDESCCCTQPPRGMRANCPRFRARTNYHGHAYIDCTQVKKCFSSCTSRNKWYAEHCCCGGDGCTRK